MPKNKLFLLALTVILVTAYIILAVNASLPQPTPKSEVETAINQAKHLYSLRKQEKEDFSTGPCLSDALMPNWVVDIVHNPRQEVDNLEGNQCPSYVQGRSSHFVELDTEGNLIRAK